MEDLIMSELPKKKIKELGREIPRTHRILPMLHHWITIFSDLWSIFFMEKNFLLQFFRTVSYS